MIFTNTKKACDSGDVSGCYNLGLLYKNGSEYIKQYYSTAKRFYGKACDFGEQIGCDKYNELQHKGY